MSSISLCMIVKDEEAVLARCLDSIKDFVDEIIIVDTGSTDSTKMIAKTFTENVFDFNWNDNFSDARNYSFSFATSDYIMWLDADDIVPKYTLNELMNLKHNMTADVYMLKYAISFLNNKPTFSFYRERILRNCKKCIWQGCVHECITPFGKIERLNISIEHHKDKIHDSNRNLNIYKKTLKSRPLNPREQYYYSRELFDHKQYKKCITEMRRFISSKQGWIENIIDAHYIIAQCYDKLNMRNKSLQYLLKTFELDSPRANICCKIGDFFMNLQKYDISTFWHKLATNCHDVSTKGGFTEPFYYNYYPYLQLCKSYYFLHDIKLSKYYNNLAEEIYPESEVVKQNKLFFKNISTNQDKI